MSDYHCSPWARQASLGIKQYKKLKLRQSMLCVRRIPLFLLEIEVEFPHFTRSLTYTLPVKTDRTC